jgi:CTP:molybdopterin cytidylyltransferase MocA
VNYGIVPAAGRSSRLGRNKALLPLGNSVVLDHLVSALRRGGADPIVVVVAEGDEALQERSASLGLRTAVNARPARGMLSSIHCGLCEIAGDAVGPDVLVICPVDYPAIADLTIRRLIAGVATGDRPVATPMREGRRGHPLALRGSLISAILALDLDRGLRQLLERYAPLAVEVADPGIHQDLDTWADYSALNDRAGRC